MGVTEELRARIARVVGWDTLDREHLPPFNNYGIKAIEELGQEAVPFFKEREHVGHDYTGFVRGMSIGRTVADLSGIKMIEEADFAYIQNGSIKYTQTDKSKVDEGVLNNEVSLMNRHFRIDESYFCFGFPRTSEYGLVQRIRRAGFLPDKEAARIEVIHCERELDLIPPPPSTTLTIRIDEPPDEARRKYGYGSCGAIEMAFESTNRVYGPILEKLQQTPNLFSTLVVLKELLPDVEVHQRSGVYYGFKNREYGKGYSPTKKVIERPLRFHEAMDIAFPEL